MSGKGPRVSPDRKEWVRLSVQRPVLYAEDKAEIAKKKQEYQAIDGSNPDNFQKSLAVGAATEKLEIRINEDQATLDQMDMALL